ncbi:MAG: hypothetical protein ICV52_04985, partial [Microcoleus sp. C1-bin4]|nr:hypothetical protein [Microcoleus sp. C1-bin4]
PLPDFNGFAADLSGGRSSNIRIGKLQLSVFNRSFRLPDRSFSSIILRSTDFSLFARSLRRRCNPRLF